MLPAGWTRGRGACSTPGMRSVLTGSRQPHQPANWPLPPHGITGGTPPSWAGSGKAGRRAAVAGQNGRLRPKEAVSRQAVGLPPSIGSGCPPHEDGRPGSMAGRDRKEAASLALPSASPGHRWQETNRKLLIVPRERRRPHRSRTMRPRARETQGISRVFWRLGSSTTSRWTTSPCR